MPSPTSTAAVELPVSRALALGLLHGSAELLPISSSGHVTLVPWLLRWPYAEIEPELRKAFEVALHAGTATALLLTLRDEVGDAVGSLTPRRILHGLISLTPSALAGATLERQIESRCGTPATVAAGLAAGSLAMLAADRSPQRRRHEHARAGDALLIGLAQACALVPGVSRGGATIAAARFRRFRRDDAGVLSRHAALPVIVAATALKGFRLSRRGLPAGAAAVLSGGALSSFLSTLVFSRLLRRRERDGALTPYGVYRLGLAAMVAFRLRSEHSVRMSA